MRKFKVKNVELPYVYHLYNNTWQNERCVEVAFGKYFIDKFGLDIVEVGAVMPYYGYQPNVVVDIGDAMPQTVTANAVTYDGYKGKNLLSISTIEHFMVRECGNTSNNDSITFINRVINEANNYLVTWAVGYNEFLDAFMKQNPQIPRFIIRRNDWFSNWDEDPDNNNFNYPFGHGDKPIPQGFFNNANAVCVVTNLPEFINK